MLTLNRLRGILTWKKVSKKGKNSQIATCEPLEEIERVKPKIDELLQLLQNSTDYATLDVKDALKSLADIPLQLCPRETLEETTGDDDGVDDDNDGGNDETDLPPEYVHFCQIVGRYLLNAGYVQLFGKIAQALKHHVCGGCRHERQGWQNFGYLCWGLINYAEFTPEIGNELDKRGGIGILFQALDFLEKEVARVKSEISNYKMQLLVLCVVYHCRRDNVQAYRQANAVAVLTKYLNSKDLGRKTYALLTLATVIRDQDNDLLKAKDCTGFLVQLLEEAVDSSNHTAVFKDVEGIFVYVTLLDILDGLNQLALNDENKRILDHLGGTVLANKILQAEFTDDEKAAASEILWALAFDEQIKKNVTFLKAKDSLRKHRKSSHKALRRASGYAMWEIDGSQADLQHTDIQPAQQEHLTLQPTNHHQPGHVMLSYQWDSQKLVERIKKKLDSAGFNVWMDIDHMRDDMLQAMALAVQRSDVVVICMSEKYKNSKNARSEATYAYTLGKRIIPLLVEDGFTPDEWLGLLVGMRLYYRFCTEKEFKANIPKVIDALRITES
ncbi:uncharacterized protein [Amphiura filiformis]|uniref:uncharacterized protein n=1 Tax=Amphiura filiformis TaxID=82378 RepID=UPI003B226FF5